MASKCIYCNSNLYGSGCPYSPHKKHVHTDVPGKCIYCGSSLTGSGCPYNPTGKIHVRGAEYNNMIKEQLTNTMSMGMLLSRLIKPIRDTEAYRLQLVDENGKRLREPVTDQEKAALTPLDVYMFRMRRLIGEDKCHILKSTVLLDSASNTVEEQFDPVKYGEQVKLKLRVDSVVDELSKIISEATQNGISLQSVESTILDSISKSVERHI